MSRVWIKKYSGTNYFYNATFVDELKLDTLLDIPILNYDTENNLEELGKRWLSDFDIKVSFLDGTLSRIGKTVTQFFRDNDDLDDYFYSVSFKNDDDYFSGFTNPSNRKIDLNLKPDGLYAQLLCYEPLRHWIDRVSRAPLSSLDTIISNGDIFTFEEYLQTVHFAGLTSDKVIIRLPSQTYLQKLQPYGAPAGCWFYGDIYNFLTNRSKFSRWETFKELSKGLGFSYEMYISPETVELSSPEYIFNIFFLTDLQNETPIDITTAIAHEENGVPKSAKWLYMQYRQFEKSGIDYSNGIVASKDTSYDTDADNAGDVLYPSLLKTMDGLLLSYDEGTGGLFSLYKDEEFLALDLKLYEYSHASGGAVAKLGDPNPNTNDGFTAKFAYSYCFKAATGSGFVIDRYNHKPIQKFAVQNYKRYLRGYDTVKKIIVSGLEYDLIGFKSYKPVTVESNDYYVSGAGNLNLKEKSLELELSRY